MMDSLPFASAFSLVALLAAPVLVACGARADGTDGNSDDVDVAGPETSAAICTPRNCTSATAPGALDDGCGGTVVCECRTEFRGELSKTACGPAASAAIVSGSGEHPGTTVAETSNVDAGAKADGGGSADASSGLPLPEAGSGTADASPPLDRCAPRNLRALAGYTFTLTVLPNGGILEITGDDTPNVILMSGAGAFREVALGDGSALGDVIVPCVSIIRVHANGGNDEVTVGAKPTKFDGVVSVSVGGGTGEDVCTVNAGGLGSASAIQYNEEG